MKTVIYARVINSVSDEPIENGMVEIEDDHIVYVGEKRECTDSDAQIFDLEGKTVMPGFIDAHAHLCGSESIHKTGDTPYDLLLTTVRDLKDLVDAGVTGVRDMSAFGASLKRAIEAGLIKGPRIMPGGRVMSISSGHCDMNPMLSPEEIRVIVEEAARHNTYVTAHCTGTEGTKQAIKNGVKCIEHGVLLDEECVQMMAEKNIPLVTTLSVSLGLADMKGLPDYMTKKAKALGDASKHSFALAHQYGIRVALGTDYSNSPNTPFHEIGKEFYSLTRCGYTNMEAIKAGTINGAYLMKSDDKFGSLEAGKLADLVVVDGDPSEDIMLLANADHVRLVMIGGEIKKNTL